MVCKIFWERFVQNLTVEEIPPTRLEDKAKDIGDDEKSELGTTTVNHYANEFVNDAGFTPIA